MECGSRIREDTIDPLYAEGSDREVYPELARANLLRMQGKYEEAIEVCRRIMGRFPSNETVHALLGDIYADQGKLEDAIQWYELLVELAPTNVHYNAKLHNLRAMRAAQVAPPPPVPEPEAKPAKPKTLAYALFGVPGVDSDWRVVCGWARECSAMSRGGGGTCQARAGIHRAACAERRAAHSAACVYRRAARACACASPCPIRGLCGHERRGGGLGSQTQPAAERRARVVRV
jgi:tetratricopeptide (TPR) repeat protein